MKARITKYQTGLEWYRHLVGCVFDVRKSNINSGYIVTQDGFEEDKWYIEKEDCEIIPEKYTYLDIDLPEWWDGRPIYGEAWRHNKEHKSKLYCHCVDPYDKIQKYRCGNSGGSSWYEHFEPLPKQTSAKVVITKDGKVNEVELTADQIERLGLK